MKPTRYPARIRQLTARSVAALALLLAAPATWAGAYDHCVDQAARAFQISPVPIQLLIEMEGGAPGVASPNANGSHDLGIMQINDDVWAAHFQKLGVSPKQLRDSTCTNIYAGTYVLMLSYVRTGNMAQAMADYHSSTPKYASAYLDRLQKIIRRRIAASNKPARDSAIADTRP